MKVAEQRRQLRELESENRRKGDRHAEFDPGA
jgi:hypothetical protein